MSHTTRRGDADDDGRRRGRGLGARTRDDDEHHAARSWLWEIPLVSALAAFMLWIRLIPARALVLGERAYFIGQDPFYHYRETLGIVRSFPRVPRWDPWTFYPYGTATNQFGTLFDWIAAAYVVLTQGKDASELYVQHVLGVYPAILGALIVIPFYLLAKRLLGLAGAIIASITLALLPGEFLLRSLAGYSDHHVAEALFSLLSILGVYVAVERGHAARAALASGDGKAWRRVAGFGALGGLALGLDLYVWPPALLFLAILTLWLTIVIIVETARGEDARGMVVGAAISFAIAGLMMIPVMETTKIGDFNAYGLLQVLAPLAAAAWLYALDVLARRLRARRAPAWWLPTGIAAFVALALIVAILVARSFVASILWGLSWVTGFGAQHTTLTIAEASPSAFFCSANTTSAVCLSTDYGILPAATFLLLLALLVWTIRLRRRADILLLVWSIVIFRATDTQVRFGYYLAINMALLLGWAAARIAELVGLGMATPGNEARAKGRRARGVAPAQGPWLKIAAVAAVLVLLLPGNVFATKDAAPAWKVAQREPDPDLARWLDGLAWMRANTPDAGVDLGLIVPRPAPGTLYDYPASSYGVLSWWDYGHWIEAVAQRPPVANPFQQAASFAATWFTQPDPTAAEAQLDAWTKDKGPVRYVWVDDQMATGKYAAIAVWAHAENESRRLYTINAFAERSLVVNGNATDVLALDAQYQDSMLARLYDRDADGLSHYRLVYEHPDMVTIGSVVYDNGDQRCVTIELPSPACDVPVSGAAVQQWRSDPTRAVHLFADTNVYDVDVRSRLKLFERVEGARLVGTTTPGANVSAEVALEATHADGTTRAWTHRVDVRAASNGAYELVFPYATDAMAGSIVGATSQVTVRTGTGLLAVDVPEAAVRDGARVRVG